MSLKLFQDTSKIYKWGWTVFVPLMSLNTVRYFLITDLQKHKLVEGVVPLHEDNAVGQGPAQIAVPVVGVPPHTALSAPLCVWNFCSVVKLPAKQSSLKSLKFINGNFLHWPYNTCTKCVVDGTYFVDEITSWVYILSYFIIVVIIYRKRWYTCRFKWLYMESVVRS